MTSRRQRGSHSPPVQLDDVRGICLRSKRCTARLCAGVCVLGCDFVVSALADGVRTSMLALLVPSSCPRGTTILLTPLIGGILHRVLMRKNQLSLSEVLVYGAGALRDTWHVAEESGCDELHHCIVHSDIRVEILSTSFAPI